MKKGISVNGRSLRVAGSYLTFEDIVRFALVAQQGPFDTVTYYAPRGSTFGGLLKPGQEVPLEEGMVFAVERSPRA
jgi:Xaa-Pro aminopeptidase